MSNHTATRPRRIWRSLTNLPWLPLTFDETRAVFAPLAVPWWIAGGWAIDVYLGRQTREHADIDVSMLRGDHPKLCALLDEFELHIVPILLGDGERLLEGVGTLELEQVRAIEAPGVTHIRYRVVK